MTAFSINVVEIYSFGIRGQDVRFGWIPLQLVPGLEFKQVLSMHQDKGDSPPPSFQA